MSIALFLYLRTGDRDPALVMDLGLGYMVASAFAIGVLMHWDKPPDEVLDVSPMITWVGPIILMFAPIDPYMAPEMAGDEAVDGRADLYALGCVAYYALTRRLVFEAATPLQVIARHLHDAPVAPSQRSEMPVPPALDRLILACLAKSPAERPPSAAELARSLAAVEVEPWSDEQAIRWWKLHRAG